MLMVFERRFPGSYSLGSYLQQEPINRQDPDNALPEAHVTPSTRC